MLPSDESLKKRIVVENSDADGSEHPLIDSSGKHGPMFDPCGEIISSENKLDNGLGNFGAQGVFYGPVTLFTDRQGVSLQFSVRWKVVTTVLRFITVFVAAISGLLEVYRIFEPLIRSLLGRQ